MPGSMDCLATPAANGIGRQNEDVDMGRVLKVLRALPKAFLYQYAGTIAVNSGNRAEIYVQAQPSVSTLRTSKRRCSPSCPAKYGWMSPTSG